MSEDRYKGLTPTQILLWKLYEDVLYKEENMVSDRTIIEKYIPNYTDVRQIQHDRKILRTVKKVRIKTTVNGSCLDCEGDEKSYYMTSKICSIIYTGLVNGDITKKQLYAYIYRLNLEEPVEGQMKFLFEEDKTAVNHVYNDYLDPDKMSRKELENEYKRLGGVVNTSYLSTEWLLEEVKRIRKEGW